MKRLTCMCFRSTVPLFYMMWLSILLTAAYPQALLAKPADCELLFIPDFHVGSTRITSSLSSLPQGVREWFEWTLVDFESSKGRVIDFSRDQKIGNLPVVPQEILLLESFTPKEVVLIKRLLLFSQSTEYKSADVQRRYESWYRLLQGGKDYGASEQEIRAAAIERAKSPGVEVGAWVLYTKQGEIFTAIHTSGNSEEIDKQAVIRSIRGVLESKKINPNEITSIQYFHTHPNGGPLSVGDRNGAHWIANVFWEKGLRINIHTYAITTVGDKIITFHAGQTSDQLP